LTVDTAMKSLVLVIPRHELFGTEPSPHGFGTDRLDEFYETICRRATFIPRSDAERCYQFKQVIPYMLVAHGSRVFMLHRYASQTEARLHDKYSIGVGGHIDLGPDTGKGAEIPEIIEAGLRRELHEELDLNTEYSYRPIGYLNDDSNDVGQVHFGLVFLVRCESDEVAVRENDMMEGKFASIDELTEAAPKMETWSQLLVPHVEKVLKC